MLTCFLLLRNSLEDLFVKSQQVSKASVNFEINSITIIKYDVLFRVVVLGFVVIPPSPLSVSLGIHDLFISSSSWNDIKTQRYTSFHHSMLFL